MRCFTGLAAILFILTFTAAGFGESALPDLKGTWIMKTFPILHEKPGKSPPPKLHTEKTGVHDFEMLMVINHQDGFRFSGYRESGRKKETIIGTIGFDNHTVYMVGDGGMDIGRLVSPDKMESVYLRVTEHHSITARTTFSRKR